MFFFPWSTILFKTTYLNGEFIIVSYALIFFFILIVIGQQGRLSHTQAFVKILKIYKCKSHYYQGIPDAPIREPFIKRKQNGQKQESQSILFMVKDMMPL